MIYKIKKKSKKKKLQEWSCKCLIKKLEKKIEEEKPENSSSDLELELNECIARRTRLYKENWIWLIREKWFRLFLSI